MPARIKVYVTGEELEDIRSLVCEVVDSYRREGCKLPQAYEETASDLGLTARGIQAWRTEPHLVCCTEEMAELIRAGHAAHAHRQADRFESRARQLRARMAALLQNANDDDTVTAFQLRPVTGGAA